MLRKTGTIIDQIVTHKQEELAARKREVSLVELKARVADTPLAARDFEQALRKSRMGGDISLIAEIKKASPSAGVICGGINHTLLAQQFEAGGADALSVLTDERFFQGRREYVQDIRLVTALPLLRKDFIIDPYQIYETKLYGADAYLLIASVLESGLLAELLALGQELGLACLLETHTEAEMEIALQTEARIIGINARDLRTFREDLQVVERLARMVPSDRILVSESAIKARADVERVKNAGISVILVGTSLMKANNPAKRIKELKGKIET